MRYVLYHSSCYDGFGAAFAAWKKYGDKAKYIPCSHGAPAPDVSKATEIYVVDFSFDAETLVSWSGCAQVVVLDHHKTAHEMLDPLIGGNNPEVYFDMNRSGALMAWQYFHPDTDVPMLIRWISDRDLWKFEVENSERVHKALVSHPMDFEIWDKFSKDPGRLVDEGKVCERLYSQLVENIIKSPWMRTIGDYTVPVVNTSIAWSEVGHSLLEAHPDAPFVASFTVFEDQVMWSLRSRPGFDVSEIAKRYGGGGHENAAGFKTQRF